MPQNTAFTGHLTCSFGKIGHIASEEVILQLLSTKYIPILLYGLEVLVLLIDNYNLDPSIS